MDLRFLFTSILSTIEIFFINTAGIIFAYSFFRTYKHVKKEYKEASRDNLYAGPSYEVYEEDGKYYVADSIQHINRQEIEKMDYLRYRDYEKFDYGLERALLQVRKDRKLSFIAVLFIFVSSCISINKVTQSLLYAVIIGLIYTMVGIVIVLLINIFIDNRNIKEPSIPKSIKEYEEKYNKIKQ